MTSPLSPWLASVAVAALLAGGCAQGGAPAARAADGGAAERTPVALASFTPALRCMDELLFNAGVRDVTLTLEAGPAAAPAGAGARDQIAAAVAEMTRRSRAVRLIVPPGDGRDLLQALRELEAASPFAVLPEFAIRGTVRALDAAADEVPAGYEREPVRARAAPLRALAFDAVVLRLETMSLVPGVTSRNTVRLEAGERGGALARLAGSGTAFTVPLPAGDGAVAAARPLVELATVELVGKLTRLPYWQCIGAADVAEVAREVDDWFHALDEDERVVFVKERLRERRWYDGPLDPARDEGFTRALAGVRGELGLPPTGPLDLGFFQRFVVQTVAPGPLAAQRGARAGAATPATGALPAAGASEDSAPVTVRVVPAGRGVQLDIAARVAGYVYCYARDPASGAIRRVYPNRFVRDPRIAAGGGIAVPGNARFLLGPHQEYACVHASREVYGDLPPPLRWGDFDEVRVKAFDEIRDRFAEASGAVVTLARAGGGATGR